jgi:hypothetical protein
VRSLESFVRSVTEDPIRLRRAFMVAWILAYGMLVAGFLIMVWVFMDGR